MYFFNCFLFLQQQQQQEEEEEEEEEVASRVICVPVVSKILGVVGLHWKDSDKLGKSCNLCDQEEIEEKR